MENEDRLIEFGRRIKEVRTYMKLTQKDVAEKLGITQITVSRMEQGRDVSGRKLMQFLDFYSHYISIDNFVWREIRFDRGRKYLPAFLTRLR